MGAKRPKENCHPQCYHPRGGYRWGVGLIHCKVDFDCAIRTLPSPSPGVPMAPGAVQPPGGQSALRLCVQRVIAKLLVDEAEVRVKSDEVGRLQPAHLHGKRVTIGAPKICFGVQKWSEIHSARFQAPSPNDDSGPLFGLTSEAPFDFRVLWVRVTTEAAVATGIGHLFLPTPE